MEVRSLNESAFQRALHDTLLAFRTIRVWILFVVWEGVLMIVPSLIVSVNISRLKYAITQAVVFVLGMISILLAILIVQLLYAPYRQRNEARKRVVELEGELRKPKLFDVECRTTILGLPLNHQEDGTWISASVQLSPSPITIVYRGDLVTVTRVTAAPEVRFIYKDGTGWISTNAITVAPQRPLPPSMKAPGATDFEWDVSGPSLWVLNGLPLRMAKDEPLELPGMAISVSDATAVGTHFEKGDRCVLTVRLAIRTDKGSPVIPDLSIELSASDIKNSIHPFRPKKKETDESIE